MLSLQFTAAIPAAVAGEVTRLTQHPDFGGEGAAYKAAWDRAGSSALKHCEAFARDCSVMKAGELRRRYGAAPRWSVPEACREFLGKAAVRVRS